MVVGCVELRMANNRRDKVEANVAISDQLVSNPLVKDHDAALGVRSFQIPLRISEVLISAMWHPGVLADPAHRWLRRAVITVCSALIRIDERRKSASQR
jgi:DNA-binding transcriptional LysR family regulator